MNFCAYLEFVSHCTDASFARQIMLDGFLAEILIFQAYLCVPACCCKGFKEGCKIFIGLGILGTETRIK
jgi:hypothetical protein